MIKKLTQIRKQKKITQKEVAHHLGCTDQTLCKYEKGVTVIPLDKAIMYAEHVGYRIELIVN